MYPSFGLGSNTVCIKMNKGLGKGLASAIETGEVTGQKVKEAVGTSSCARISFPFGLSLHFFFSSRGLMANMVSFSNLTVGTSKEVKEKTEQTASSAAEKGKKAAAGAREKKDEMLEDDLVP